MEVTVTGTVREAFVEPEEFYRVRDFALKEGSVSNQLNMILADAIMQAQEAGFCATKEFGLGDFIQQSRDDVVDDVIITYLNLGGDLYFNSASYPIIYTIDEEGNPIDVSLDEFLES